MIDSLAVFERMIRMTFLKNENKMSTFKALRSRLRTLIRYPEEYKIKLIEMTAEELPIHAAVSVGYFQKHRCLPEKIKELRDELRQKTKKLFLDEVNSEEPDAERCAQYHTAYCYLDPENKEIMLSEAVEKLTDQQRELLFAEVGKCIHAVHDISQEEWDFLDPILRYFSVNYSENTNEYFLAKNTDQFTDLVPAENTIGELLTFAVKKKYFNYFRILYTMFPGWHMNQNELTSDEFIDIGFEATDVPEHLLMIAYTGLQLCKKGHTYFRTDDIRGWLEKVRSFGNSDIEQAVSYIYYSQCIETDPENAEKYVHEMPYYKPDRLFSEVMPLCKNSAGAVFVQHNTDTLLRENPVLLREYLKKTGENNEYRFDKDLCLIKPERNSISDYRSLISGAVWECSADEILEIFLNTHIRAEVGFNEFGDIVKEIFNSDELKEALGKYTFSGELYLNRFKYPEEMKGVGFVEFENINDCDPVYYSVYVFQLAQHINIRYLALPFRSMEQENLFLNRKIRLKINSFDLICNTYDNLRSFIYFDDYRKLPDSDDRNVIKYFLKHYDIFWFLSCSGYSSLSVFNGSVIQDYIKKISDNGIDLIDDGKYERRVDFTYNDAEIIAEGSEPENVIKESRNINDMFCCILKKMRFSFIKKVDHDDSRFLLYYRPAIKMTVKALEIVQDLLKKRRKTEYLENVFDLLYKNDFLIMSLGINKVSFKVLFEDDDSVKAVLDNGVLHDFFDHYELQIPGMERKKLFLASGEEDFLNKEDVLGTIKKMVDDSRSNEILDYLSGVSKCYEVDKSQNYFIVYKQNNEYNVLVNRLVRNCSVKIIKEVYLRTDLRKKYSLNDLFKAAYVYKKLDDLIKEFYDIDFYISYARLENGVRMQCARDIMIENWFCMEADDTLSGLNDNEIRMFTGMSRLLSYDNDKNCIIFSEISKENDLLADRDEKMFQAVYKFYYLLND